MSNTTGSVSASEIMNTPIEFTIGGVSYLVKRIGMNRLYSDFETIIKNNHIKAIKDMALLFEGKERQSYVTQGLKDIPNGENLMSLCSTMIDTTEGRKHTFKLALSPSNLNEEAFENL